MSFVWRCFGFWWLVCCFGFFPYPVSGQILEEVFQRSWEISFFGDGPKQPAQTVPALCVCMAEGIWAK